MGDKVALGPSGVTKDARPDSIILYVHGIGGAAPDMTRPAKVLADEKQKRRERDGRAIAAEMKWGVTAYEESRWGEKTPQVDLSRRGIAKNRGLPLKAPASLGPEDIDSFDADEPPREFSDGALADVLEMLVDAPSLLGALKWDAERAAQFAEAIDSPAAEALREAAGAAPLDARSAPASAHSLSDLAHLGPRLAALATFKDGGPLNKNDFKNYWDYTYGEKGAARALLVFIRRWVHRQAQARLADLVRYVGSDAADPDAPFLIVCGEIIRAAERLQGGPAEARKLALFGHSLGGVILYDVLTAIQEDHIANAPREIRRLAELRKDIEDLRVVLVTAGSQIPLFENLGVLKAKRFMQTPRNAADPVAPVVADAWLNVYDPRDWLGFGVGLDNDRQYACDRIDAHEGYFGVDKFRRWLVGELKRC